MITDIPNVARNVPKFLDIVVVIINYGNTPKLRLWKASSTLVM
jgi:hypothetical protein